MFLPEGALGQAQMRVWDLPLAPISSKRKLVTNILIVRGHTSVEVVLVLIPASNVQQASTLLLLDLLFAPSVQLEAIVLKVRQSPEVVFGTKIPS